MSSNGRQIDDDKIVIWTYIENDINFKTSKIKEKMEHCQNEILLNIQDG